MYYFHSFSRNEHFRIFNCLKSQKTIFQTLQSNIQNIQSQNKKDKNALMIFDNFLNEVLNASYGILFKLSYGFSDEISKYLKKELSPNVEKIGYQILSACLSINRLVSLLNFPHFPGLDEKKDQNECLPRPKSPISSSSLVSCTNQKTENEDNVVLCRICGKKVSLDKIDKHSNMCKLAYFSTQSMMTTDEKMKKLQIRLQQILLTIPWPENENYALDFIIPILHIITVLDKAIYVDVDSNNDILDELNFILNDAINNAELKNKNDELFNFYKEAYSLIIEKITESEKLSKVMNVVQETTTEKPGIMETTIADFQFLKRISSGAYAQVFLAKRKVTNDLCAIKVISKSEIQRKDDKQRILLEKNILQQITTPYMTQFCMFFHNISIIFLKK